jgi:hypothetical protein
MAGEEEAWRPLRLWRWNAQPAASLDEVPGWIGWLAYAAALTITGGPAFCYLAYQLGQRDGVHLQSTEEPYSNFRWRLVPWALLAAVLYLMPMLGFKGLDMPLLLLALGAPLAACLVVAHIANLCYKQGLRLGAKTRVAPESLVTSGVWTWALTGVFFLATFLVYYLTYTGQAVHNHPVRLADAFLNGRLDVANGKELLGFLDFAIYDDKYYPLEPPGTALVILLGVALFGLSINQTFVSLVIGAITGAVVWRISRGIMQSLPQQIALTILFAFGTVYWWNSTYYGVWYFNHAVAVLFLCGAVYETLVGKRPLTAGLLLGAAYITRAPTIWAFPFFLIMFSDQWLNWVKDRPLWKRIDLKPLLLFGAGAGLFVIGFALLNYIRFDTPSPQASYDHWHATEQLSVPGGLLEHGLVSTEHIERHRPIFFEKPFYMTDEKPYIYPSWNGAAFWATTPAFLYAFLAAIRKRWLRWAGAAAMVLSILLLVIVPKLGASSTQQGWLDRAPRGAVASAIDGFLDLLQWDRWARWQTQWPTSEVILSLPVWSWLVLLPFLLLIAVSCFFAFRTRNKLVLACWAAIIPVVVVHFLAASTGWPQFGYRYILDYVPFVFLLTWQGMGDRLRWHNVVLIAASVVISFCGVLWVNKFEPDLVGGFHWANW